VLERYPEYSIGDGAYLSLWKKMAGIFLQIIDTVLKGLDG
jgi:hypothetical protein